MSAKAIDECTGKHVLGSALGNVVKSAKVTTDTDWNALVQQNPWLNVDKLVVKIDQLIKRRGKNGLVKVNLNLEEAKAWIAEHMEKTVTIGPSTGTLRTFVIEPFVAHEQSDEYYICILAERHCDKILFHHEGGVDIGDVDSKAVTLEVSVDAALDVDTIESKLLMNVPAERTTILKDFILKLYNGFRDLFFTYLEINPLVVVGETVHVLDLAAKLDQTAEFLMHNEWGSISFPAPFGRDLLPEEKYIQELDAKSGASLKLTVLNITGRVWTMVAGGGASVIYSDTICDLGFAHELANYGEYSGAPSKSQTFEYARVVLKLMTQEAHPDGKVLIIGGGIANFTNVAATFNGIIQALTEYQHTLQTQNVKIFVRRGGPNYQEGLRAMRELGENLELPIHVYGPETHMTAVVGMALGTSPIVPAQVDAGSGIQDLLSPQGSTTPNSPETAAKIEKAPSSDAPKEGEASTDSAVTEEIKEGDFKPLFSKDTRALFFGIQPRAVQGMLDFDFACGRKTPSVAGMIYPFSGNHSQKFYWGTKDIMLPVYQKMEEAMKSNPDVDVLINFASLRSAYDSTMDTMDFEQIRVIGIIAEGIPENLTRKLVKKADEKKITVIGPATVGGIKAGCFKIGNTGGMMDNILSSKLYRPGSVAYVSRSGGMSNELNNIIARNADGIYEGVAIGGDRYPGSTFIDHLFRYQDDPNVKMLVLLGEVGGIEEYQICEAIKSGRISKPMVAWCIGTCAKMFTSEVQFGHAGACANSDRETALAKNKELTAVGCKVPESFDDLGAAINEMYNELIKNGSILPKPEPPAPKVPIDYKWAAELGLIRKPAQFVSTISDERGEELLYAGMPITDVFKDDIGIGGVVSLLWFKRRLPPYACKFIEMCLMVTADHGPAVSGAHNTIVAARAGKDLVSSLCSGLLTIGDRFGGALNDAASQFSHAYDSGWDPRTFVTTMRKQHKLIMGIGHRVKSLTNPDVRVEIIKNFVLENFPRTPLLEYALQVEQITTAKKPNLILNVDGVIAVSFVDLLRQCGAFTSVEAQEYIDIGCLNGLFVLGRTTGFIGHYIDQKRLKQSLYRHPWDDISYQNPTTNN